MTLQRTIEQSQAYSFDHPRACELHRTIGKMICVDFVPMYTVEKPGFRRLLNILEPRYTPCSRTYLSQTLIPEMYSKVMSCVSKLVDVVPYVSITTDLWTGFIRKPHWSLDRWQLGMKRGLFPRSTIQ